MPNHNRKNNNGHAFREKYYIFHFVIFLFLENNNMSQSTPPTAPKATYVASPCGRYVYRCRKICFADCTGGPECLGEKLAISAATPSLLKSPEHVPEDDQSRLVIDGE